MTNGLTVAAVDLSDRVVVEEEDDSAAAKENRKKEENRKKRERQKKKKASDKVAGGGEEEKAGTGNGEAMGRWHTGKLPGGCAERGECGGGARGLGVYAAHGLCAGACVASAQPALSCVFDDSVETVCGFCFAQPPPGATTDHEVTLTTSAPDESGNRSFGLKLDDHPPKPTGGGEATGEAAQAAQAAQATEPLITVVTKESPNREAVHLGDRIVSIDGVAVEGGHAAAVPLLVEGAKKHGGSVPCVVRRPAMVVCPGCKKLAACSSCVSAGRLAWHSYECALYRSLPAQALKGETATLRLLIRYKVATEPKIGDWPSETKEPVHLLTSLQVSALSRAPRAPRHTRRTLWPATRTMHPHPAPRSPDPAAPLSRFAPVTCRLRTGERVRRAR
jgi:hypothetical protein